MGMFKARMPRKYRPVSIYSNSSKERLDKLVREVKREQGENVQEEPFYPDERFKGQFLKFTPHAQRAHESSRRLGWPVILVLIAAMLLIWYYLQTGRIYGR